MQQVHFAAANRPGQRRLRSRGEDPDALLDLYRTLTEWSAAGRGRGRDGVGRAAIPYRRPPSNATASPTSSSRTPGALAFDQGRAGGVRRRDRAARRRRRSHQRPDLSAAGRRDPQGGRAANGDRRPASRRRVPDSRLRARRHVAAQAMAPRPGRRGCDFVHGTPSRPSLARRRRARRSAHPRDCRVGHHAAPRRSRAVRVRRSASPARR